MPHLSPCGFHGSKEKEHDFHLHPLLAYQILEHVNQINLRPEHGKLDILTLDDVTCSLYLKVVTKNQSNRFCDVENVTVLSDAFCPDHSWKCEYKNCFILSFYKSEET